jgi:hypothetical protein
MFAALMWNQITCDRRQQLAGTQLAWPSRYRSLCSSVPLRRIVIVAKQSASRIALTENPDLTIAGMTFVFRGKRAMGSLMTGWPTLLWILGTLSR